MYVYSLTVAVLMHDCECLCVGSIWGRSEAVVEASWALSSLCLADPRGRFSEPTCVSKSLPGGVQEGVLERPGRVPGASCRRL